MERVTVGRRGIVVLAVCAASAVLSLAAMGGTLVYRANVSDEFRQHTSEQCHAIESLKAAIRLVFQDNLTDIERRRTTIDPAQYRIARDYYQRQLARFAPAQCP